ncbi:MAG: glycosyltransferase involved in cell wall biosynthesis [Marinomonas primoryensis]|jgi:glycosyltransferase involved in cell wall biosynthesis
MSSKGDDGIVHIANNFISSKVHGNLIASLSRYFAVRQKVFVPVRDGSDIGVNDGVVENCCEIKYSYCIQPFFRYFPLLKVLLVTVNFLLYLGTKGMKSTRTVIAHTLWSDGMVAFFTHLMTRREYILIVRNTDINIFLPMLPHYRFLIKFSIKRAKALVFVSYAHKDRFHSQYSKLFNAASIVKVIPNGLDDYWLNNISHQVERSTKKVIYVGRFDKNKNLAAIIDAVESARKAEPSIVLTLVGGSADELRELCCLDELPQWVKVIGHITDQSHLLELYRAANVFVMPSFHETFGLVYLEALSQGCPFVYTKNEGVDGYFNDESFAIAVDPYDIKQISESILLLIRLYPEGVNTKSIEMALSGFSWKGIADRYLHLIKL